jgi:hypothetical protein
MKIAVLFAGHTRNFVGCYKNIQENLLLPLRDLGETDVFVSTWNAEGFRNKGWSGEAEIEAVERLLTPKSMTIESFTPETRAFFVKKFFTFGYHGSLSSHETSGDAASMWWKIWSCFKLMKDYQDLHSFQYDLIVRVRFDMLFDSVPNLKEIKPQTLYIPKWNGKYAEVTCEIMDQFSFGDFTAMERYCSVFPRISGLISRNVKPLTAEGFLFHTLGNFPVEKIDLRFSVLRPSGPEKVCVGCIDASF